jgi:hypothetical protein
MGIFCLCIHSTREDTDFSVPCCGLKLMHT